MSRSPRGPLYRLTKAEAETEAARIGGTVRDVSYETAAMPDSFWVALGSSTQPAMLLIREHAARYYGGGLESAWNDACEGHVRGVRMEVCIGIDDRIRERVRREEWLIVPPADACPAPPTSSWNGGGYSEPTGDPIRDAARRAAEGYACGDSMTDE